MTNIPPTHPYSRNCSYKNSHFPIASIIIRFRDDYLKLAEYHKKLLKESVEEYQNLKPSLKKADRKNYKRYHKLLKYQIKDSTIGATELNEELNEHLYDYTLG